MRTTKSENDVIIDSNFPGGVCFLQATLNFFSLPHEPKLVIESLIVKLIRLLRAILLTR